MVLIQVYYVLEISMKQKYFNDFPYRYQIEVYLVNKIKDNSVLRHIISP